MSSSKKSRGPGSYTPQACSLCRARKRKCDGIEPTCGFCQKRGDECVWGSQPVKKPASKQLLESLKNRVQALEQENRDLREELSKCTCPRLCRTYSYDSYSDFGTDQPELLTDTHSTTGDSVSPDVEELCAATKRLVYEEDEFRLYGPTSAFSLSPKEKENIAIASLRSQLEPQEPPKGRYVLYANDNFEWDRHLTESPLTRSEHDRLLDNLFPFTSAWCMALIPDLFLRDMYRSLSSPDSVITENYSPMLHNAIISFASSFSDDPVMKDISTRRKFLAKAKSFLDKECQKPNISTVQALEVIGTCHMIVAELTLGYMYFGMAGRICQALGLSENCAIWIKQGAISEEDATRRNWAYWALFANDVYWSLYVGRDFCLPDPEIDIEQGWILKPVIDNEIDKQPWISPVSNVPVQPGRINSVFVATVDLMRIGRRIMHVVNSGARNYRLVSEIDLQLNAWKDNLSPELDITPVSRESALPHRLTMHLAYWWLFSILHRPFYHRRPLRSNSENEIDHVKICDRAAQNIVALLATYDRMYGLRYIPSTPVQAMFSAGTISLLSAIRALSGSRVAEKLLHDSLAQADLCLKYLTMSSKSFECAGAIKDILENMFKVWVVPRFGVRIRELSPPEDENDCDASIVAANCPTTPNATVLECAMEPWEQEIFNSSEAQEFFPVQQPMDTYASISSGTSMLSNRNIPEQPFMTFTCDMNAPPLQEYSAIEYSGDFSIDPSSVSSGSGVSTQQLIDELTRYWS